MFLAASICGISDFYMDIKLGQAKVPFALREDNVHLSLCSLKKKKKKIDRSCKGHRCAEVHSTVCIVGPMDGERRGLFACLVSSRRNSFHPWLKILDLGETQELSLS